MTYKTSSGQTAASPVTRRRVLKYLAAGSVGLTRLPQSSRASQEPASAAAASQPAVVSRPAAGPILVETSPVGAEIWQVTFDQRTQSGIYSEVIYCEVPYCSRDSRYFVYGRANSGDKNNLTEFMVVELGSFRQHRLDAASGNRGCAVASDGVFYYLKGTDENIAELMRVDLGVGSPEMVHRLENEQRIFGPGGSLGTVSPDHRWWAVGKSLEGAQNSYGILLLDLRTGHKTVIDSDRYIFNSHPQFNPAGSRQLMIQQNRGGQIAGPGQPKRTVGPEGGTLYLLSVPDGRRTPLPVGQPDTSPITGHEAWAGTSGQIIFSVVPTGKFGVEKGNLLGVLEGEATRVVAKGFSFNHLGVSRCGRFFVSDDWRGTYRIVIGSVRTGKTAVLCDSRITGVVHSNLHPHAWLTPDLKWVIFNSDRSGWPQVYAASVPASIIRELSEA